MGPTMDQLTPPPPGISGAFGATGDIVSLSADGRTWRVGGTVLKAGQGPEEAGWAAEVYATIRQVGFRVPRPVRARDGAWVVEGWCAWDFIPGAAAKGRWREHVATALAFHEALRPVARPAFLNTGTDPWSRADRLAWGEEDATPHARILPSIERLMARLRPVTSPSQAMHGDLGVGNVLHADGLDPAIIDFSPSWRPAVFSLGVAAADAIAWEGANPSILAAVEQLPEFDQLLARATLRRLWEVDGHWRAGVPEESVEEHVAGYAPVVDLVCARLDG